MTLKKRIMSAALVFTLITGMLFSFGTVCSSADDIIKIKVNNHVISLDADPYIKNGRTMLPVAEIVGFLGGTSEWNGEDETVRITYDNIEIEMQIGSNIASVNDCLVCLDAAPEIKVINSSGGGRTMVPLRFIAEEFGFDVYWSDAARTVEIYTGGYDPDMDPSIIKVFLNGKKLDMDVEPFISNNRTMVPVSTIVHSLGGTSKWDNSTSTASLTLGGTTVKLTINSLEAKYNGKNILLDTAPVIETVDENGGGRTMVPIRFVAESFGFSVDWDSNTSKVLIDSKNSASKGKTADKKLSLSLNNNYKFRNETYSAVIINSNSSLLADDLEGTKLTDPYRYYIDFKGYTLGEGKADIESSDLSAGIVKIRSAYQEEKGVYRVVVDLNMETEPYVVYSMDGTTMMLLFKQRNVVSNNTADRYRPENYHTLADGRYVVVLDPGHGMTTGGKRSFDETLMEWEFNRDIAYRLKKVLEAKGVVCVMTVAKDEKTDISLANRAAIANDGYVADIFVSIHANAYGDSWNSASGWEIYYYKDGIKESLSKDLAQRIQKSTLAGIPEFKDRGVKTEGFAVIKNTKMPSVLIEHGFYTNKEEVELLKNSGFRDRLVKVDAEGIMAFLEAHK